MKCDSVHELVASQFGDVAASYALSLVHGNASELADLIAMLSPRPKDRAIDVATGAGHLALAIAPHVASVVAFDLTKSMLDQTLTTAQERGLLNIRAVEGAAEALPFEDESFDIYTVRLAPHHFADIRASIREASRILRQNGRYLVVDTTSPEDDLLDQELNEIEYLRDPSHVRNYRVSEWLSMLGEARLSVIERIDGRCGMLEFEDWTQRQKVPPDRKASLFHRFGSASQELRATMEIERKGDTFEFTLPQSIILANKSG